MTTIDRNRRKTVNGSVVSNKADKTILVQVETYRSHPEYKKRVKYTTKFQAHDEKNEAKVGDKVVIMESKPYSKTKT